MHEKRARFNHDVRSRDAIVVQGNSSSRRGAGGKNYDGDHCKPVWVKRAELKPVENSNALKVGEEQGAQGDVPNTETSDDDDAQLLETGSEASCVLKHRSPKISDTGNIHQQPETHMVQKEASLEVSLQNSKNQVSSVSTFSQHMYIDEFIYAIWEFMW
jgi:hypothetical protein